MPQRKTNEQVLDDLIAEVCPNRLTRTEQDATWTLSVRFIQLARSRDELARNFAMVRVLRNQIHPGDYAVLQRIACERLRELQGVAIKPTFPKLLKAKILLFKKQNTC